MDHDVQQQARAGQAAVLGVILRRVLDRLIDAGAGLAAGDAQESAVVQAFQEMRADIEVAAPAFDAAVIEVCLHVFGVRATVFAHEGQHVCRAGLHSRVPPTRRLARVEECRGLPG